MQHMDGIPLSEQPASSSIELLSMQPQCLSGCQQFEDKCAKELSAFAPIVPGEDIIAM